MSKMLAGLVLVAATLGAPVVSFAQSDAPMTPVQSTATTVAAQNDQQLTDQAVGGVAQSGSAASGRVSREAMQSSCVGPVSFCNVFFGS
jgi:hypothetical protein